MGSPEPLFLAALTFFGKIQQNSASSGSLLQLKNNNNEGVPLSEIDLI
jgi:hypothetical protein